ncbi:flap endonuclease-1 [Candidatus Woesearchaeota archaeon CG10_big_fil_rev_8_21_14_0_10_37_12]|nr:MAG: flap endonuclease-1 [Candidatus Woesearchaeota archaeon CG10_big_fil_rev_8_21_14_0_10_37_12]
MGVNFREIIEYENINIKDLAGKTIVVDGHNTLYQFLSNIRSRDGGLLTDSQGNVTSHLIGLFARTTKLMQTGIKLAFVFDGKPPAIKHAELEKRTELKKQAAQKYEEALEAEDEQAMQKYAARTSKLTKEMVQHAKNLLDALGIPYIQAPSEGEAQASYIVKQGHAWAVASQDYDSLLYGTPRLIQNLSIEGKKKQPGKFMYKTVEPKLINLAENLKKLELTKEQLIWLSLLVGNDYAPKGVKGIGPKKGLELVKKHKTADSLFAEVTLEDDVDWKEVISTFEHMPVEKNYDLTWKNINKEKTVEVLVEKHDFDLERVKKRLDELTPKVQQKGLRGWF